jgi:hypothetical protein
LTGKTYVGDEGGLGRMFRFGPDEVTEVEAALADPNTVLPDHLQEHLPEAEEMIRDARARLGDAAVHGAQAEQ